MRTASTARSLLALLIAVPLLAACSSQAAPAEPTWTKPTPTSEKIAVSYPMPDLGPSPTPTPLTDAEQDALRLENRDFAWEHVVANYPDAVRPEVTFRGYTDQDAYTATFTACLESAGIAVDVGRDEDGNPGGIGWSTDNADQAVAIYVCQSEQSAPLPPPPSDEMLGYIYDYLTLFLVPCYEANGGDNPPAPSREDFIANWPNQNWWPAGPWEQNWAEGHSVDDVCPTQP